MNFCKPHFYMPCGRLQKFQSFSPQQPLIRLRTSLSEVSIKKKTSLSEDIFPEQLINNFYITRQ